MTDPLWTIIMQCHLSACTSPWRSTIYITLAFKEIFDQVYSVTVNTTVDTVWPEIIEKVETWRLFLPRLLYLFFFSRNEFAVLFLFCVCVKSIMWSEERNLPRPELVLLDILSNEDAILTLITVACLFICLWRKVQIRNLFLLSSLQLFYRESATCRPPQWLTTASQALRYWKVCRIDGTPTV